ncbi:MAG: protease modulator HflC [Phycisphaerae bacterium]|jgi:membrane protease subunit HflC
MKNLAITILVILIVVIALLLAICFQVRDTEAALVTRLGKPSRTITDPGLHIRWPAPIERLHKFDTRMRVYEAALAETTTKGAIPIILHTFVIWQVEDPLRFYNAVQTVDQAQNKLYSLIQDTQNKVVGRHEFSEFVNSDPTKTRFAEIENEMLQELQASASQNYGINIKTVGIKQLKVNEDTTQAVFARMRSERNRKTEAILSEGNARATAIRSDADTKKQKLLAAAEGRAKAIRGAGDAEAAKYYEQLKQDPEFAMFLREIDALKKALAKRSTIVISADSEPFRLLKEMPELQPLKQTNSEQ